MKKLVAGIVSVMLILSLGMTAFAAETVTEQKESGNYRKKVAAGPFYTYIKSFIIDLIKYVANPF